MKAIKTDDDVWTAQKIPLSLFWATLSMVYKIDCGELQRTEIKLLRPIVLTKE